MAKRKRSHHRKRSVKTPLSSQGVVHISPLQKIWFLFLWSLAVLKIVFAPLIRSISLVCITTGLITLIWLGIGGFYYGFSYAYHEEQRLALEASRVKVMEQLKKTDDLLENHPTSRELLILKMGFEYQLGNTDEVEELKDQLLKIDPNHQSVLETIEKTK
jgi:hypothetical protein